MDEIDGTDGGSGFDTSGLIASLASNATQAYETTAALNANPLNTALVYGGAAQTTQGMVTGAQPYTPTSGVGGSGLLLLVLAAGVIIYAATR